MTKKNILIRTDFVIYNTKSLFNKNIVKIPSWVMQDVIENNKRILIKFNDVNLALYTTEQLKKNLVTVESKLYTGKFQQNTITYNLCQISIDINENKDKKINIRSSNTKNSYQRSSVQ